METLMWLGLWAMCIMWAIGTFIMTIVFCEEVFEVWWSKLVAGMICLPIWVLLGIGPAVLLNHEAGPELATLLRSEWHCAGGHYEAQTSTVMAGKVPVSTTSNVFVCDAYARGASAP